MFDEITIRMRDGKPGKREIILGVVSGLCGLAAIAVCLSIVDPYLRDPDGAVFSLSQLIGKSPEKPLLVSFER